LYYIHLQGQVFRPILLRFLTPDDEGYVLRFLQISLAKQGVKFRKTSTFSNRAVKNLYINFVSLLFLWCENSHQAYVVSMLRVLDHTQLDTHAQAVELI